MTAPDGSVYRPKFNDANLLEAVDVNLRGAEQDGQPVWTPFITFIDYDAKGQRTDLPLRQRRDDDLRATTRRPSA